MDQKKERDLENLSTLIFETVMGWPMSQGSQDFAREKLLQVLEEEDPRKVFSGWKSWSDKVALRVKHAQILYRYFGLRDEGVSHEKIRDMLATEFAMTPDGIRQVYKRREQTLR